MRRVLDDLKRSATCKEARVCPRYVAVSVDQFNVQRRGTPYAQLFGIPAVVAAALHLPAKEPISSQDFRARVSMQILCQMLNGGD